MHHGWRNEFRSDLRSYEHFWTSSWHKARTGFEPMTHDLFITARITSVFVSSTAVHIYDFQSLFTTWKVYLDPVSRALHQYLRGHGFKTRTGLNFFQALFQPLVQQGSPLYSFLQPQCTYMIFIYLQSLFSALELFFDNNWVRNLKYSLISGNGNL